MHQYIKSLSNELGLPLKKCCVNLLISRVSLYVSLWLNYVQALITLNELNLC